MLALSLVVAPMLLALPDRPMPAPPSNSWVGKTVYPRISGMYLDTSVEPITEKIDKKGPALNLISYRVYDERPDHVQVRTREGLTGWLRKADLVPLEDAVAFFTKQIEANPKDQNAFNRRAAAWRAKGELDAALKDASEALKLSQSSALYNNRALIWQAKKDYVRALEDYAMAFRITPQYPLGLVNRAGLWQAKKDYDQAIADTTQAIQAQPQFPNAYRVRGVAYHGKKEFDKAIADFNRSIEQDAKSAQTFTDRANSYAGKKERAKAHADHLEALRLEPTLVASAAAAALFLSSCPDSKCRDGKRALEIARRVQKLERNNTQVLQALAAAHAELGQFKEAVQWQEHALQDSQLTNDKKAQTRLEFYRKMQPYRSE